MKKWLWAPLVIISMLLCISGCSSTSVNDKEETYPDVGGYRAAPIEIYHASAADNDLGDTLMFVDGVVGDVKKVEQYDCAEIRTSDGTIYVIKAAMDDNWENVTKDKRLRVYFLYQGMSSVLNAPAGMYVGAYRANELNKSAIDHLTAAALLLEASANSNTPTPAPSPSPTPIPTIEATATINPSSTPKATPKSTPKSTPKATAKDVPESTPKATPITTVKPSTPPSGGTVYWVEGGTKYHRISDCVSLSRSTGIRSGSITQAQQAGKTGPCKNCH